MHTIGHMAEISGLSRSTLLYYHAIGLLVPSGRSESGYRLYGEGERRKLEKILLFRGLGVPLDRIRGYLAGPEEGMAPILLGRMLAINGQIDALKEQQMAILDLLEADGSLKDTKSALHTMEALGEKVGITQSNYLDVHRTFEKASSRAHRRFLLYLGFTEAETRTLLAGLAQKD